MKTVIGKKKLLKPVSSAIDKTSDGDPASSKENGGVEADVHESEGDEVSEKTNEDKAHVHALIANFAVSKAGANFVYHYIFRESL